MDERMSPLLDDCDVESFARNGFVLGGRALSDDDATRLYDIIQDIVTREDNPYHRRVYDFKHGGRPFLHIKNMWKRYDEFRQLHRHPGILDALRRLIGTPKLNLWQDRFFYKPARSGSYHTWHQDMIYLPFLQPYTAVSAWVALNEATDETGAMRMVPGSHLWPNAEELLAAHADSVEGGRRLPATFAGNEVREVSCPVPKGYVHFHHGRTWHCSTPNWSSVNRLAIGMFFVGADVRFDGENRWARDYEGVHGEPLPSEHYPYVEAPSLHDAPEAR